MNLTISPVVNFKSDTNLIAEAMKKNSASPVQLPSSKPISEEQMQKNIDEFHKTLSVKTIEDIVKTEYWEKTYNPATNSVHAKIPNSYDGKEFDIYSDGKVISNSGWDQPKVEKEKDKKLAQYVAAMKSDYENSISADKLAKDNFGELSEVEKLQKNDEFNATLKSRKWKKEYLPENDIIIVRPKRVKDGIEYMIKNDGTIMETGLRQKAIVIVEPNSESAKVFAKLKQKYDPNVPKKSLWMKSKEVVADIWKFFSVAGTMTYATCKGLLQGSVAGAAVLAGTYVIRGAKAMAKNEKTLKEVIKHPLLTAGKTGKILAAVTGVAVLTGNVIAGRLRANQNSAVIEHKIDVAHVND